VVTQVPGGQLTLTEQSLVEHVRSGELLDLTPDGEVIDEATMRSWGDPRTCRASVIRDILCVRLAADPDPHGLRLRGSRITGRLDLENLVTNVHLELTDCLLEEGVLSRGAHLASIALNRCHIEHATESPLDAAGFTCSMFTMTGARITGHCPDSAVNLRGAQIGGSLDCDGAIVHNDMGPALEGGRLRVTQDLYLRAGFTATGGDAAVNLRGAHISGNLECDGAVLRGDSGPALDADGIQVGQNVYLRGGFTATGDGDFGAVNLRGAHIGGQLSCIGAKLINDSGPALEADGVQVGQNVYLRGGFTATGDGDFGAVNLRGAHINGNLECDGAVLRNACGPALKADALQVGQHVFLRGGFDAIGAGSDGAVRLAGAHFGGNLECTGAKLRNESGAALDASNLRLIQDMILAGFNAVGNGADGAVHLSGARIGGDLGCDGAMLSSDSGPGLRAFRLQVDGDMDLTGGFTATGSGDRGAVRLTSARIGGSLNCSGAKLTNDSGPALLAYGMQVGQDVYLTGEFTAISGGNREAINLRTTRVSGSFDFEPEQLEHRNDPSKRLRTDGLTYTGVPGPRSGHGPKSGDRWRELLREGTPFYTAQPYQQLAAGYRALGDDQRARQTLMAQRSDQLARADASKWERAWGRITKLTLGYGYQPWRALLFLGAVVFVSCVLAVVLGAHGALAQTTKTTTPGRSCTVVQQVSVGLDLNLPVGTSVARADCDLTSHSASVTAAGLSIASWVLRVLAWVFAALFIAGFTSAVRKT
jgi:hypothetical protein